MSQPRVNPIRYKLMVFLRATMNISYYIYCLCWRFQFRFYLFPHHYDMVKISTSGHHTRDSDTYSNRRKAKSKGYQYSVAFQPKRKKEKLYPKFYTWGNLCDSILHAVIDQPRLVPQLTWTINCRYIPFACMEETEKTHIHTPLNETNLLRVQVTLEQYNASVKPKDNSCMLEKIIILYY